MNTQEETTPTQAEIARYRQHMKGVPPGARFFLSLEREEYESEAVTALLRSIPRLYALNFDDQVDVPPEIHYAIEVLERDLGLIMELDED